jgi:hypothetical protein
MHCALPLLQCMHSSLRISGCLMTCQHDVCMRQLHCVWQYNCTRTWSPHTPATPGSSTICLLLVNGTYCSVLLYTQRTRKKPATAPVLPSCRPGPNTAAPASPAMFLRLKKTLHRPGCSCDILLSLESAEGAMFAVWMVCQGRAKAAYC